MTRDWAEYSSGDDDSVEGVQEVRVFDYSGGSRQVSRVYPVRFTDHQNIYARIVYDIEGNPLKDINGVYLNVYTSLMKAAFDSQHLRLIHCMKEPTYRFFVTSVQQLNDFYNHRQKGASYKRLCHVYVDEDVDRKSQTYLKRFSSFSPSKPKSHKH